MATTVDEFGRVIPAAAPLTTARGGRAHQERDPERGRSPSPTSSQHYGSGVGGGGRGRSRSRHHHHHHHHHRDRDHYSSRDRDHHSREWRKRPRSPSSGPPNSKEDASIRGPATATSRLRHPSYRYVEEPMVCEYVWKSQHEQPQPQQQPPSDEKDNGAAIIKTEEEEDSSYDNYRKRYCLNYVRSFFNTHMDDSWFRSRYSPLGRKRVVLAERERAQHEAASFQQQALVKEEENNNSFVVQARLGRGIKTVTENPTPLSHCLSFLGSNPNDHVLHINDVPPHVTDEQLTLALMDHCLGIPPDQHAENSPIAHIAPEGIQMVSGTVHAINSTTTASFKKHPLSREAFLICSAAVKQDILLHLHKAEQEGGDGAAAKGEAKTEAEDAAPSVVVPRKDKDAHSSSSSSSKLPQALPLDVECSDPYGRLDVDADGKGGAPEDGVGVPPRKSTVWVKTQYKSPPVLVLSAAVSSKERFGRDKEAAIMMARALDVAKNIPPEQRLDEVLDKLFGEHHNTEEATDASLLEDTLDVAIAYLRRVHLFSFYNGCTFSNNVADILSGRHPAGTIHLRLKDADDLLAQDNNKTDNSIANNNDNSSAPPPKDLLVQRLDDNIAKALEECNSWIESGNNTIVDEQTDREAAELEQAEEEWKDTWLENHAIIDDDGRARCSFHFCHKLFKDKTFLRKHLQKKHKEYLKAEMAQLHDEYMMKAWDGEDQRPVPPVLVDCGANFDLVPSPVVGAEPAAEDPEPDLWRKEEERRKLEEELAQQRAEQRARNRDRDVHQDRHSMGDHRSSTHHHHSSSSSGPPPRTKNFVDVDDMKEEKVEMSFDNVDVPVQPPKKKKKKKKLL